MTAAVARLTADRTEIALFVDVLYRYATLGTRVSLRAFTHTDKPAGMIWTNGNWRFPCVRIGARLVDRATRQATLVANFHDPAVFCPPIATFKSAENATADNLADVLVLSVECDARPNEALASLASIIGPPTLVMASGGRWVNPDTGEIEDKAHLHWRLSRAATTAEDHVKAHRARRLMRLIVGGDSSAVPAVHPLKWAGSWNCKDAEHPRMARIVALNEVEVTLDDALAALEHFVESCGVSIDDPPSRVETDLLASSFEDIEMWTRGIPNPHPDIPHDNHQKTWEWWNHIGMATWAGSGGSPEGLAIFQEWSWKNPNYQKDGEIEKVKARWRHYRRSPPTKLGAGTLCFQFRWFYVDPPERWDLGNDHA